MRRIAVALLAVLFLVLASDVARGCVCYVLPEKPTPEQARERLVKDYNEAFAVFTGEVIALDTFKVKFKVDKLWKGDLGGEVTMSTGAKENSDGTYTTSSCDFGFRRGEKYLVFAYGASAGEMRTHVCTRTGQLKDAERETQELDEVWPPKRMNQADEEHPPAAAKSNKGTHPAADTQR